MGLKKGLAGLLGWAGISARHDMSDAEEIHFMDAINAHIKCKVHLQSFFDGKSIDQDAQKLIVQDDQCVLGKWIHGSAFSRYRMSPEFYQLRAQHAQMHHIAGNVLQHLQANNRVAAETLMEKAYSEASRKVVKALTELSKTKA